MANLYGSNSNPVVLTCHSSTQSERPMTFIGHADAVTSASRYHSLRLSRTVKSKARTGSVLLKGQQGD